MRQKPQGTGERVPTRLADTLRRYLAEYWTFFLIPLVLTGIFWGVGWVGNWAGLPRILYMNLVITLCVGGAIYLSLGLFGDRVIRNTGLPWLRFLLTATTLALALLLGGEAAMWLIGRLPGLERVGVSRQGFYAIAAIVVSVVWLVESTVGRLRDRARQLELREEQARRESLRAQFEALQARTNPHFLYNSLNTVAGLIEEDPRAAERALEQLSDLLRYSLDGSRRDRVALSEEITAVQGYLDMERLRFGDRLKVRIELEPGTESLAVPPLVLQPLVENAVLHGIAPRMEGGSIRVAVARRSGMLELVVEDDGPGPGGSSHQGSRTAIHELGRRLDLLYDGRAGLEIGPGVNGGFRVEVRIPSEDGSPLPRSTT